ncbi:MAG: vWA domain-containing protein [Nannocystales bacterium]
MKRFSTLLALASLAACASNKGSARSVEMSRADGAESFSMAAEESPGAYAPEPTSSASEDDAGYAYEGGDGETAAAPASPPAEAFGDADDSPALDSTSPSPSPAVAGASADKSERESRVARSRSRDRRKAERAPLKKKSGKKDRRRRRPEPEPEFNRNIQAGRLTAGAFDDTLNPDVLTTFANRMAQQRDTRDVAERVTGAMTIVRVVDSRGRPIRDADVRLNTDQRGARVPTGTDGRAVFFAGWDLPPENRRRGKIEATIQHGRERMSVPVREGTINTITMRDVQSSSVNAVDIALVIDATGSMGDEIDYLKVELRNIARTIERSFPRVDQRFALVVYRDDGDAFVSRSFDFTENLSRFESHLARQSANGGGDYPEAMDAGLEDATDLSWSRDSAKIVFLVADAPPHAEQMRRTMDAVDDLRSMGAAFYPVAASGVASEAEIVMRAAAAGTGGQYVFLTDDSGVGNGHAEPHIPCYEVQSLRNIMIRMVHTELAGERISAGQERTIRSVGRSTDGVCHVAARRQ